MRVIGIQKDLSPIFFAHAPDERCRLPCSEKFALSLRDSHDHRHAKLARRVCRRLQDDQLCKIEMPDGDSPLFRVLKDLSEHAHRSTASKTVSLSSGCRFSAFEIRLARWWRVHATCLRSLTRAIDRSRERSPARRRPGARSTEARPPACEISFADVDTQSSEIAGSLRVDDDRAHARSTREQLAKQVAPTIPVAPVRIIAFSFPSETMQPAIPQG
jgi:hypothetical protein